MQLVEQTRKGRRWEETLPDGTRQGYINCSIDSQFYESTPDSGQYDSPIDVQLQRVDNAQLDGYRVTQNGWHFAIQTEPAQQQQSPQGTVGFGGRQGQHWFRFRLQNVGYLHWPTRDLTDLGGAADYSTAPVITEFQRNVCKHSSLPDDIRTSTSTINWPAIWTTPGGGEVSIRWRVLSDKLKEDVIVNQAAREWLAANRPPTTPANETWFGFRFAIDASDIPKAFKDGVQFDLVNDDIDDDNAPGIELCNELDELLAFMPIDQVFVPRVGGNRPLRKRFYRQGGQTYLVVAARVDHLNSMPDGDLVFDPAMSPSETVAAGDDDGEVRGGIGWYDNLTGFGLGVYAGSALDMCMEFTPNVPADASFTSGGEYATLSVYRHSSYTNVGTSIGGNIYIDVGTNRNAAFSASAPTDANVTNSTANTPIAVTSDPGSGNRFGSGWNVAAHMEERCTTALGWNANDIVRFVIRDDGTNGAPENCWAAAEEDSVGPSVLDAFYNASGGASAIFGGAAGEGGLAGMGGLAGEGGGLA